jgi:DNA adenine methylase
MHYLGGKARTAARISEVLSRLRKPGQIFVEPFCGACWITQRMDDPRYASDVHPDLIMLWQALQRGWVPPEVVSEEEYARIRTEPPSALRGFIGFGCSFSGKFFGGYARDPKSDRNYTSNARNSLLKKIRYLRNVHFRCADYRTIKLRGCFVYCDPPYAGATGYTHQFDNETFWSIVRQWSRMNTVVVSEYKAPVDAVLIAEFPTRTDMGTPLETRTRESNACLCLRRFTMNTEKAPKINLEEVNKRPLSRKELRQQAGRLKAAERKRIAKARAEQDRTWARLRRHVEGAVLYEVEHRTPEGFDKETRRVQEKLGEFVKGEGLSLSMTVASFANYLSRLAFVMEKLQNGELAVCPVCAGKVMREGETCQVCKGTTLLSTVLAQEYERSVRGQVPGVATQKEIPPNGN